MARPRGRSFPVRRGPKRLVSWVGSANQGYVACGAGAKIIHQSFPLDASVFAPDATIVRTRGMYSIRPQVYTAQVDIIGAFGMGIVSDESFAIGASAMPGPWSNPEWEGWFVWESFAFRYEESSGSLDNTFPASFQMPFDSKAMRKMGSGQTMVVIVQSQSAANTSSINFRQLYKSH